MSEFPKELYYSQSHEWVRMTGDDTVTVGITDHAQHELGDLVFVELPELNINVEVGDEVVVLESVKTAADVYSPISGEIIAVNESVQENPAIINQDPYSEGWLFRIKLQDKSELDSLMDANAYQAEIAEE